VFIIIPYKKNKKVQDIKKVSKYKKYKNQISIIIKITTSLPFQKDQLAKRLPNNNNLRINLELVKPVVPVMICYKRIIFL